MFLLFWREYAIGGLVLLIGAIVIYIYHSGEIHCQNAVKIAQIAAQEKSQKDLDIKQYQLQQNADIIINKLQNDNISLQKELTHVVKESHTKCPLNSDWMHLYNHLY